MNRLDLIPDYELLDCGDGRRLERFAHLIVDRPAPQAIWPKSKHFSEWEAVDAYYDRPSSEKGQWNNLSVFPDLWHIKVNKVTIELRASSNNQIGIFPEQLPNWCWLSKYLQREKKPMRVLNAFAYTGVATLVASASMKNIDVCHVDGSKSSVSWARHNAKLSGLQGQPIRWIVDDVLKYLKREVKRRKKYDAFILDPPAFGSGPGGSWKLERDLPHLLDLVNQLMSDSPCLIILSCHASGWTAKQLLDRLKQLEAFQGGTGEEIDLIIPSKKGNNLPSSICGRIKF